MAQLFNADEIFEIAEQIERNGAKFYEKAAGATPDDTARDLFLELAAMEKRHEDTFANLRAELPREDWTATVDPEGEAALYLRAVADGHIFDLKRNPADSLKGNATPAEVLRMAIDIEKDSVAFYVAMQGMVPAELGEDKISKIIIEEIGHVRLLSSELASRSR